MKILLIHNNYGTYSGEETVVDRQITLFTEMGHQVSVYRKTTEGFRGTLWGNLKGFFTAFYSCSSVQDIKQIMKNDKPNMVIIHNLYPYISPAILKYIKKAGVPIIMTVHNFRLICPTGLFMRDSQPCELCLEKGNEWSCIRHNCEHSYFKSIGYAGRNCYARLTKAYIDNVDKYACITAFQKQKLIEAGFDKNKITVIPNFIDSPSDLGNVSGEYVAYIGRLSYEKGYDLLMEVAKQNPTILFHFAGSLRKGNGELIPQNVQLVGHLNKKELAEFIKKARFVVMPSRCYEGFPMAILEAATYYKPTIGPAHAGFLEIIDNNQTGLLFEPGNVNDLQEKIIELWNDPQKSSLLGKQASIKLKENYITDVIKEKWSCLLNNPIYS
jgi:glycosyltransferase involved in cell wall biosynthesis